MAKISKVSPEHDPFKSSGGIAAELAGLLEGYHTPGTEAKSPPPRR